MLVIAAVNAVTFVTDASYVSVFAVVAVAPSDVDFDVVAAVVDVGVLLLLLSCLMLMMLFPLML